MNRTRNTSYLLILAAIVLTASAPGCLAQTCNLAVRPCVDQPVEGTNVITGYFTAIGVAPVAGATLGIKVNGQNLPITGKLNAATGEFTFTLPHKLSQYDYINVFQSGPPMIGGGPPPSTGDVPVAATVSPGKVCSKDPPPCLTQPLEGAVTVTGNLQAPPAGAVVGIKLNGVLLGMTGQLEGSKFTFSNLHPLSQYDTIEVIQSSPVPVPPAVAPSTGVISVQPATSSDLRLTIPVASSQLAFGHQAMQSASAVKTVTITNSTNADVNIEDVSTTLTSVNYSISSNSCSSTIAAKGTCSFGVTFTPVRSGPHPGTPEKDFIVIVPKTPQDWQKFRTLRNALRESNDDVRRTQLGLDRKVASEKKTERQQRQLAPAAVPAPGSVAAAQDDYDKAEQIKSRVLEEIEQQFQVITLNGIPDHWTYPLTRAVVGVDLSAPSAQAIKQAYLVDFDLLAPLKLPKIFEKNEDPIENRLWLWFNPRITSLPQAANFSALSTIDATGSFFNQESSKGTLGDIQGLDVNGGFEIAIVKPRDGIPWWAEYPNTQARLAPSLLVGVGMSTPFSTDKTDVISTVNASICNAFDANRRVPAPNPPIVTSGPAGLVCQPGAPPSTAPVIVAAGGPFTNIDFFTPERSRFFRKAYVGFRLKTYFFSRTIKGDCYPPPNRGETRGDCDGLYNIFPGTIDLTFGKDEAVTAGHLSTWLFRLDANYPLPFYQGVHLFASMYTGLRGNNATQPFNSFTINTPVTGSNNDANTFRFGLIPLNRDYFRVGIGVDLIQVFKKSSSGGQPTSQAAPVAAAAAMP